MTEQIIEQSKPKHKHSFKDRYDNDPAFKKKHLEYVMEKVKCEYCERNVSRCNMSSHHKTARCSKKRQQLNPLQQTPDTQTPDMQTIITKLQQQIEELQLTINTIRK